MKATIRLRYTRSPGYEDEPLDVKGLMPSIMAMIDSIRCANKIANGTQYPLKFRIITDLDLKCFDIEIDDGLNPIFKFFKKVFAKLWKRKEGEHEK